MYVGVDGNCQKRKSIRREEIFSRWLDHLLQGLLWVAWRLLHLRLSWALL
jgi:hypothetical protein